MLSKLNKWLFERLDREESSGEGSADQALDLAIQEIERSILAGESSLQESKKTESDLRHKITGLKDSSDKLFSRAKKLANMNRRDEAADVLEEKEIMDRQVANYQEVHRKVKASLRQMQEQVAMMRVRLEEAQAKKVLLKAKLENASSKADVAQAFMDLENSSEFSEYEDQVADSEARAEALAQISGNDLGPVSSFESPVEEDPIEKLNQAIEREKEEVRKANEAAQAKKMDAIFKGMKSTNAPQANVEQNKRKAELLAQLQEQKGTPALEKDKLQDFFADQSSAPQAPSQDKLSKFFGNQSSPKEEEKPKSTPEEEALKKENEKRIKGFFDKKKEDNDDKKNKLDQFFGKD